MPEDFNFIKFLWNIFIKKEARKPVFQDVSYFAKNLLPQRNDHREFILLKKELFEKVSDPVLLVQRIAKAILDWLKIKSLVIHVAFNRTLPQAGIVELTKNHDIFVEIREEYKLSPSILAAILAHEVMHVYLNNHSIRLADTLENERLTDIAVFYFGLGVLYVNGIIKKSRQHDSLGNESIVQTKLGYLEDEEIAFLFAKLARWKDYSTELLNDHLNSTGRRYYEDGVQLLSNYADVEYSDEKGTAICDCCLMRLRFPANRGKIKLTCPTCSYQFIIGPKT